jgi:hypothetical protein
MRRLIGFSIISRLSGILCAFWLCAGSAWAGDGGSSLASIQSTLNALCAGFGFTCPQLPTISQAALEYAAQFNLPTEMIRSLNNAGTALLAANPAVPAPTAQSPLDLSSLTPLGFISGPPSTNGQAAAAPPYDSDANGFFFAVATIGPFAQPDRLQLIYDDLSRTKPFVQGQRAAKISLPLVVLTVDNNGGPIAEREVPTSLQLVATCTGAAGCATTALATGNFSGNGTATYSADQIGLNVSTSFTSSPILQQPHAVISVNAQLIVTSATDPAYFFTVNPFIANAFSGDEKGFKPTDSKILGSSNATIGIAPFAAPLCPSNQQDCSTNPPQGVFGFCASLPNNSNGPLLPAVAAFVAITTAGETLVSAPVGSSPDIICP